MKALMTLRQSVFCTLSICICLKRILLIPCLIFSFINLSAQTPEYFGAGYNSGVNITSSPTLSDTIWKMNPIADNTMNGSGMDADYFEASRFLMQSTLGFSETHVSDVLSMGLESWLDDQKNMPIDSLSPRMYQIAQIARDSCLACGNPNNCDPARTPLSFVPLGWWEMVALSEDLLRQRVAQALSQIIVVSRAGGSFSGEGDGLAAYYDIIQTHALGNYADLLFDISLNPAMGQYLTHVNNPKTDVANFIFPDENYGREILQLFTVGLWELNNDGTQKLDGNNNPIPTYDNADVAEYSKIFTGLSYGGLWTPYPQAHCANASLSFGMSPNCIDKTVPMIMYENQHEPGEKYLLNNVTIPSGQNGLQDIRNTVDALVLHPNTAPFVSYRLIQRLVKSNPSPAYVNRVANVFKDNGSGVAGDLFEVVKAILLDEEARDCAYQLDEENGKMREPLLRYTHFTRMMDIFRESGDQFYWNQDSYFANSTKQGFISAPSVFNFYNPDDKPKGPIEAMGLVAPEFKLLDQVTSPGYVNQVDQWTQPNPTKGHILRNSLTGRWCGSEYTKLDLDAYVDEIYDYEYFLNWLDKNFTAGTMSDYTRQTIRDALSRSWSASYQSSTERDRIHLAIYLTLISPDFVIIR